MSNKRPGNSGTKRRWGSIIIQVIKSGEAGDERRLLHLNSLQQLMITELGVQVVDPLVMPVLSKLWSYLEPAGLP